MPGAMIAIARMNIPAIFVYGGTIKPGRLDGRTSTIVSAFEAVGQYSAEKITDQELGRRTHGLSRRRFVRRDVHREHHVVGDRGDGYEPALHSSTMAAEDAEKADSAAESAACLRARSQPICSRTDHDAQSLRERHRRRHGDRRFDQCRPSSPCDRSLAKVPLTHRRFRGDARAGSRAVRPQAVGPIRRRPISIARAAFRRS